MKPFNVMLESLGLTVASRAEAWIETFVSRGLYLTMTVASRAEAWIETSISCCHLHGNVRSPPVRRRGLKQDQRYNLLGCYRVASRAEAWIETASCALLPMLLQVASRAEAWIETDAVVAIAAWHTRRLPCGGVD